MTKIFGADSTTDEVLEGIDLTGKRVLVTGLSAGLGVETARALAAHGAHVVGAARDLGKARSATKEVRAQAAGGGGLELVQLDLASLASVRACADALMAAGVHSTSWSPTPVSWPAPREPRPTALRPSSAPITSATSCSSTGSPRC
jgi:GDP-D-mannose dehydratase